MTDLVLRRLEVIPTSAGHRLVLHCHEVESVDGKPRSSREIVYDGDAAGHDLTALFAEVEAVLAAIRARDYA